MKDSPQLCTLTMMVSSLLSDETLKSGKNSQVTYKTKHYKCNTDDFKFRRIIMITYNRNI